MKDNELLQFVYKTAEMGVESLRDVQECIQEDELRQAVQQQINEYEDISQISGDMLRAKGLEPKGPCIAAKISSEMCTTAQTMVDPSSSKIAEMVIEGNNMGIVKGTKHLNDYSGNDAQVKGVAERLLQLEEGNVQQMKKFL